MTAAKLYAISLMYTLNLRNELRGERMTQFEKSVGNVSTHAKRSAIPDVPPLPDNMNMGRSRGQIQSTRKVDGIYIETQTSTWTQGQPIEVGYS